MFTSARAGIVAALVTLLSVAMSGAGFAQKAFQRDDLADMAIKLEAQIKSEAGPVDPIGGRACARTPTPPSSATTTAPACRFSASSRWWHRRTRATGCAWRAPSCRSAPATTRERTALLERAATAAYIAYQRTKSPAEEADSLLIISRSFADRQLWRPALDAMRISLDLREVADVRTQYERLRETHGFRLLDYSVDADAASPRACFQFSEDLPGPPHRPVAFRRGRRPGPPGADRRYAPALRRRASSTASATTSRCAPASRRSCARRSPRPPSSTSMCVIASPWCASPPAPMCCRAPASAASR